MRVVGGLDVDASRERVRVLRARGVKIGEGTLIGRARLDSHPDLTEIGQRCAILDDCVIIAHDVAGALFGGLHVSRVHIRDNTVLLPGVYVLPGVTIGPNVVVAPRSVVASDIPPNSVAAGHPATVVGSLAEWLDRATSRRAEHPELFTLLPAEDGFRDQLLRAWRQALSADGIRQDRPG
jgi:serine acetyltransferase